MIEKNNRVNMSSKYRTFTPKASLSTGNKGVIISVIVSKNSNTEDNLISLEFKIIPTLICELYICMI